MENAVSPDSSTIDQPDANINNYLAAVNDPNANKSNDNNNVFSSPKKNKQKTNHPKVKSVLKNSKNDPLANHVHKHSILIPGADEKERTRQNVTNMRELFSELQSIDETTRLNHLYKAGSIWKPEEISENQTKFGAYFLISSFNNKNPFSKQRKQNNNKKKKNEEAEWINPTVYFQFAISCDEDPSFILDRVRSQWQFMGGIRLEKKEIQALNVYSTHVIWNMISTNNAEAISFELRSMMGEVRNINRDEGNSDDPFPNTQQPHPILLSLDQATPSHGPEYQSLRKAVLRGTESPSRYPHRMCGQGRQFYPMAYQQDQDSVPIWRG